MYGIWGYKSTGKLQSNSVSSSTSSTLDLSCTEALDEDTPNTSTSALCPSPPHVRPHNIKFWGTKTDYTNIFDIPSGYSLYGVGDKYSLLSKNGEVVFVNNRTMVKKLCLADVIEETIDDLGT